MNHFHKQLKTPEEVELDKKQVELNCFLKQLDEREVELREFKKEIKIFEHLYEEKLGHRIAILEELEWQLSGLLGQGVVQEEPLSSRPTNDAFTYFHHRTDLLDDSENTLDHKHKNFKTLYRDVAKTIHPDLAPDEEQRKKRQELMAIANQAYASGDRKILEDILFDWEPVQKFETELDIALALVKVIRDIARAQQDIYAIKCQTEELLATDIYQFKQRVDESRADGINLLDEMANTVERDIARAQNRLSLLRGDNLPQNNQTGTPLETRIIRFPADRSSGVLFERTMESVDFRDWKQLGLARGTHEVFLDKSIRLDVKGSLEQDGAFLASLQPNDIQALFLYEVDDQVLPYISGLTGLEELYLSNTEISDRGLLQLAVLTSLQRLYLYHTPIGDLGLMYLSRMPQLKGLTCSGTNVTDDGLKRFRHLKPGCKAVSFKWRYD